MTAHAHQGMTIMKQKQILDWAPRRVAAPAKREDPFAPHDSLNYCLDCWRGFMSKDDRDLSAGTMRIDYLHESARGLSPDEVEEARIAAERKRDMKIGEATDAMINSLAAHLQWAIYKSYGLSRVWRFDQLRYEDYLTLAKLELIEKLKKNVATRLLFD